MQAQVIVPILGIAMIVVMCALAAKYTIMTVSYYEYDTPDEKVITVSSKHHHVMVADIRESKDVATIKVPGHPIRGYPARDGLRYLDRAMNGFMFRSKKEHELHIILRCPVRDRIIHAAKQNYQQELSRLPKPR